MPGLLFEDFEDGQVFEHPWTRTVTETDNVLFSSMTMNPAKLHIDAAYSAKTEFGRPIVNSLFTLGLMVGMSVNDTTYGTTVANLGMDEVRFPKPVFQGDTLRVRTTVLGKRPSRSRPGQGIVEFRHEALNERDDVVATCRRSALMLGRDPSADRAGEVTAPPNGAR